MAAKFKSIYVHIGDMKAGSTSLQRFLRSDGVSAMDLDMVYPGWAENHNRLAKALRARAGGGLMAQICRAQLTLAPRASVCVLSDEHFSVLAPDVLKAFVSNVLQPFAERVHLVHYVRPHLSRMRSVYAEVVKIGADLRHFQAFVQQSTGRGRFLQSETIDAWRQQFGDAYILRPLLRQHLSGGDIVTDFLSICTGNAVATPDIPVENKSLDPTGLGGVQRIHRLIQHRSPALRHAVGYEFDRLYRKHTAGATDGLRLALSPHNAASFESRYRMDATGIDQRLGLEGHGFADALVCAMEDATVGMTDPFDLTTTPAVSAASKAVRPWLSMPLPDRAVSSALARYTRLRR
ncbi:hypothetical protein [Paracoccus thiocyanatus]|uniref:Sulfotransferase family protein n=1 Tax=Paracoccus thiocyanatus TaxID=34006 RepID=A0A3D8PCZ5_9RHOB|nr:hypothetical protein [Paracoccus thiocyanatus]RDW13956.1 hypothetical protein DIE28_05410 [Paracoccus thiocyanatus]